MTDTDNHDPSKPVAVGDVFDGDIAERSRWLAAFQQIAVDEMAPIFAAGDESG